MFILRPKLTILAAALLASLYWTERAAADCECGYLVSSSQGASLHFTNSISTDFTDSSLNDIGSDWQRANWGIAAQPNNNPPLLAQFYSSGNVYRTSQGLAIKTQAYSGGGTVYGGLIQSTRTDIKYGSFRATMQMSPVAGVCQSIFFYRSDTQETDIEFLTGEPSELHFTNQPHFTTAPNLGFDATAAFHEYRIDWVPSQTEMWVDGTQKGTLSTYVPSTEGEIIFNSWSNGDPGWSQGPPTQDAILLVKNVQLYFNTTNSADNSNFASQCAQATGSNKVCQIGSTPAASICSNWGSACPSNLHCCSQYGWCGSTSAYCGTGCVAAASFNGQCV